MNSHISIHRLAMYVYIYIYLTYTHMHKYTWPWLNFVELKGTKKLPSYPLFAGNNQISTHI